MSESQQTVHKLALARARNEKYRASHREKLRAWNAKYARDKYAADPEKGREYRRSWAEKNRERDRLNQSRWREKNRAKRYLRAARVRAEKRGMVFDLTIDWFDSMFALGSALSGLPFSITKSGTRGSLPDSASIDRIDNKKGYTRDNCRLILRAENMFKGTMDDSAMFVIAEAMLEYRRVKQHTNH